MAALLAGTAIAATLVTPVGAGETVRIEGRAICEDDGSWSITWEITNLGPSLTVISAEQHPGLAEDITDTLTSNPIPTNGTAIAHGVLLGSFVDVELVLEVPSGGPLQGSISLGGQCGPVGSPDPALAASALEATATRFTG